MNLPVNVPYRELIVKTADQLLIRNIPIKERRVQSENTLIDRYSFEHGLPVGRMYRPTL